MWSSSSDHTNNIWYGYGYFGNFHAVTIYLMIIRVKVQFFDILFPTDNSDEAGRRKSLNLEA
jgi:hypothetical protein